MFGGYSDPSLCSGFQKLLDSRFSRSFAASSICIHLRLSAAKVLPSLPLRLPFLHPCLYSLFGIFRLHQLFDINLLRLRQPLIEMNSVPRIESFLGVRQRRWAELEQIFKPAL